MPSPALLDIMTKQVEAERDEILSRANAEAARIRENAESRAAQKRTQTLAALDTELEAQATSSRERAEAAAEMVALTTKDTVTDELLDEVRAELKRIAASPEFKDVLSALLAELMADAPESGIVRALMRCSAAGSARLLTTRSRVGLARVGVWNRWRRPARG